MMKADRNLRAEATLSSNQRTHRFVHRTSANHCLIELSILSSHANPRPLETKNLNSQRLLIGFLLCALTECAAWHHGGTKICAWNIYLLVDQPADNFGYKRIKYI